MAGLHSYPGIPMSDLHKRICDSFAAQGLMSTIGARLPLVEDGEVQIELPFSNSLSQQHGYLHAGATTRPARGHQALGEGRSGSTGSYRL